MAFVHKCQATGGWGRLKGYRVVGGGRRRRRKMGVLQGCYMFSLSYLTQESSSISAHFALAHLRFTPFLSPFSKSASDPHLCPLWFPSRRTDVPLETIFTMGEKKKKSHPEPVLKNDGCTDTIGIEINSAPRSLCPNLWVQICFWPWARFGRTLCSGYWIVVVAPLRWILLSWLGCCLSLIWILNHEEQQWILKQDAFNARRNNASYEGRSCTEENALTFLQSRAGSVSTAQQFSINSKLLQTSIFDPFLHLLCVLAANVFEHLSTHTFYSQLQWLKISNNITCSVTFSLNKVTFTLQCLAPELETFHIAKPRRFVRSLLDTAVMQQNESSVCCSPETQYTAEGVLNKSRG